MNPRALLAAAKTWMDAPARDAAGLSGRAAALLARQALEAAVTDFLRRDVPDVRQVSFTVRFLVFRELHPDKALAARAAYAWSALSHATHHQGCELPPSAQALRGWIEIVEAVVA